ncbi:MAG TPA: HAD family phosphatase [Armatimonadota bacterium]|nr:HAD family phosphatase [Armatimonadota bacterium]HOS43104.1 HAD family phosphatase [Armatimonadota bacterium]
MPFDLIIFDMDDTLVHSAATWKTAEARLFRLLGQEYMLAVAQQYKGMNALDVGRVMWENLRPDGYTAEDCGRILREYLLEGFAGPLEPMPGAEALLRALRGRRLCVASGSPPEGIRLALGRFGWLDDFACILSSEGVARGKPAPDIFLAAARAGNVDPAACLVIEDSLHGVRAGKAAGMTVYAVPSGPDPAIAAAADRAFPDLAAMIPALTR